MSKEMEALKELAKWIYYEYMSSGSLNQYELDNEEETIEKIYNTQEEVITIKNALNRLEAIESAEGVEAINIINDKLKLEKTHRMSIIKWNELHTINNFILKSQQQAKELERYKKFVKSIEIDEEHNLTILNETELKKLVGGNDE